jgi:hypothetical protein
VSGEGKEDKPDKDYWKTGDPALRAKVISSVGVGIIVLSMLGFASFQNNYPSQEVLHYQPPAPQPQPVIPPIEPGGHPPSPATPIPPPETPDLTRAPSLSFALLLLPLLFFVGVILAVIGIVLYIRRRKKAIP